MFNHSIHLSRIQMRVTMFKSQFIFMLTYIAVWYVTPLPLTVNHAEPRSWLAVSLTSSARELSPFDISLTYLLSTII